MSRWRSYSYPMIPNISPRLPAPQHDNFINLGEAPVFPSRHDINSHKLLAIHRPDFVYRLWARSRASCLMPSTIVTSWHRLLDDKKAAFKSQGQELPSTITSEASFRTRFEDFCRSSNEKYYTRLLVKLRYGPINAFACAVDAILGLRPPDSLAGSVSGGLFVAIKASATLLLLRRDTNLY